MKLANNPTKNGEILCVGTELLLGDILNTNAQFLSREASKLGLNIYYETVVGDNEDRLLKALKTAERSDIILICGGLGPTPDDITRDTVAKALGLPLHKDDGILKEIEDYYRRQNRKMPKDVSRQAEIVPDCTVFQNRIGTAPGLAIQKDGRHYILMPGPPRELTRMFEHDIAPYLKKLFKRTLVSRDLMIFGMGESEVADKLGALLDGKNPTVATYAKLSEVLVRVTAAAETQEDAEKVADATAKTVQKCLGDVVYSQNGESLAFQTVSLLKQHCLTVATAESCTGGLLASYLTDISGASAVFKTGIVSYANETKARLLGVAPETLNTFGAVSAQTAAAMAEGVRRSDGGNLGVGITGVAGPEPSEGKPVGLVFVSLSDGKTVWIRKLSAAYLEDRERVRHYAALTALDLIRRYISATPGNLSGGIPVDTPPEKIIPKEHLSDFEISAKNPTEER